MDEEQLLDQIAQIVSQLEQSGVDLPIELVQQLSQIFSEAASVPVQASPQPQTPIGAELLWVLANGDRSAFLSYLKTIDDPELNALLQDSGRLNSLVENLSRNVPIQKKLTRDGIPPAPLQSSNVYGFLYDDKDRRLFVRFNSGAVYSYDGVSPAAFNAFTKFSTPAKTTGSNEYGRWWRGKSGSVGAAFYEHIRKGPYEYQRVA